MSIYISTDMEGIAETTEWDHVNPDTEAYKKFQKIQTQEIIKMVASVSKDCKVMVRDGHAFAKNVIKNMLPTNVELIDYWDSDPINMMKGIDAEKHEYGILHGYHASGGSGLSPLAHTFSSRSFVEFKLNEVLVGETTFSLYTASYFQVPIIYIVGDAGAVQEAKRVNKNIISTTTKDFAEKNKTILSSEIVLKRIEKDIKVAQAEFCLDPKKFQIDLPKYFELTIKYVFENQARLHAEKIESVEQISTDTLRYKTNNYFDLLTTMRKMKLKINENKTR